MGEFNRTNDIVLLLDRFSDDGKKLYESLKLSGIEAQTIVIEDDGFLPEGVVSVFEYYLGDFKSSVKCPGRPRYFNEVEVPPYWEIEANNRQGTIKNMNRTRGNIFFSNPAHQRFIRVVDWLDEKGIPRISEHYNKYGALYARTTFNEKGEKVCKSYFSVDGKEVICENYVTKDILLEDGGKTFVFKNTIDFVRHFFERKNLGDCRIFYNSLWIPFFVSEGLPQNGKGDILFWQEGKRNDIPGNMLGILNGTSPRTGAVMVQKRAAYDGLVSLGANTDALKRLGYVYPFTKENLGGREVLICTNSDQIAHVEDIIAALPDLHFNIAAITEMSAKLMKLGGLENVSLYPGAKSSVFEKLFAKCDIYLDINRYDEIVTAVERAFLANQLIFAFKETKHNDVYLTEENLYGEDEWKMMVGDIKDILMNPEMRNERLRVQREKALTEKRENYLELL